MEHIPTPESDVEKVYRIASVLDISLEDAALTCAGFELAFSDDRMRRAIFEIIDQLDESAAKKGEPLGLIIRYTVELGNDGIRVGRYADEIPAGEIVELTPPHRAVILLRINDNFPTQEFLGPLIVNRPELQFESESCDTEIPTDLPSEWTEAAIREPARTVICLGPIRHTFAERFPFISSPGSSSQLNGSTSRPCSGGSPVPGYPLPVTGHLSPNARHLGQQTSGLSPPPAVGDRGHSASKDVPRPMAITVETYVSHLDL